MRITPLDVRKQEFGKAMRGFDCDEVRAFLNTLADEYETVLIDNKQIRERVMEQDTKISDYQNMERTLRDTLMTAERVMQETRENANREGDLIIQEAQLKAKGVLEECRLRTEELRREIVGLRKEKETYLARFRSLAEAQIQFIDTHESDFEDLDKRLVDIVDNVVTSVETEKRELTFDQTPSHTRSKAPAAKTMTMPASAPGMARMAATATERPAAPEVAPTPPAAPAAAENDIWRDYDPGQDTAEPEPAAAIPTSVPGNIADIVSESLVEAGSTPPADAMCGDHDGGKVDGNGKNEAQKDSECEAGNVSVSESDSESDHRTDNDKEENHAALEPLNIDVISGG